MASLASAVTGAITGPVASVSGPGGGLTHIYGAPGLDKCVLLAPWSPLMPLVPPGDLGGTLQHAKGGLAIETLDVPRAVAVPGPQCTLLDVASVLLAVLKVMRPLTDLQPMELACALLRYNEELLRPGRTPGADSPAPAGVFPGWLVGLQLTLPLEFDAGRGTWISDLAMLKLWAAEYAAWRTLASSRWAQPLDFPADAFAYRDAIAGTVPASGSLTPLRTSMRSGLLSNSCAAVLDLVQTFRALQERRSADVAGWVLDLVGSLKPHHAKLLAAVSGGHGALRRLWRALADIDPTTLSTADQARLAAALQLVADDGLRLQKKPGAAPAWSAPQEIGPQAKPVEPPLAPALRWTEKILRWDLQGGKQVPKVDRWLNGMMLGRLVRVSNPVPKGDVWGLTHSVKGSDAYKPVDYLNDNSARVPSLLTALALPAGAALEAGPVDQPKLSQRMQVAVRIAENEGFLDAISAGDPGIISLGMQQWAAHTDNELTVLLERFRVQAPDHFDLFIGMWGLHTARWYPPQGKGKEPADDAARRKLIDDVNPFGTDPAALRTDAQKVAYFPQHVSFFVLEPGQPPQLLPPPPYNQPGPRRAYFLDGNQGDGWCARFRLAALLSIELSRVQLHQAAWRFSRIDSSEFSHRSTSATGPVLLSSELFVFQRCVSAADRAVLAPPTTPVKHTFAELFASQFGAAVILDTHINVPGTLIATIKDAIAKTMGPSHRVQQVETSPGHTEPRYVLDPAWLARLELKMLGVRAVPPANLARTRGLLRLLDLRDAAQCSARDAFLALSSDPASFTGW